jgi:hypothetical protein
MMLPTCDMLHHRAAGGGAVLSLADLERLMSPDGDSPRRAPPDASHPCKHKGRFKEILLQGQLVESAHQHAR